MELGSQAYVISPLIEESEAIDLQNAKEVYANLAQLFKDRFRVGILHGQMKAAEKEAIMAAFKKHELDLLVSTTVIEVGVDVPNATVMVILDADRFGLAQLHQLRGRVGAGGLRPPTVYWLPTLRLIMVRPGWRRWFKPTMVL